MKPRGRTTTSLFLWITLYLLKCAAPFSSDNPPSCRQSCLNRQYLVSYSNDGGVRTIRSIRLGSSYECVVVEPSSLMDSFSTTEETLVEETTTTRKRQSNNRNQTPFREQRPRRQRHSVEIVKEKSVDPLKLPSRTNGIDLPYDSAIQAIRAYYSIYNNLVIPRGYVVPSGEDSVFPPEWHGIRLARTVYKMKWWQNHVKQRPERVAELTKMGFVWERLQPEWNLVLEALVTYKYIYGDLLVPNKFVVPSCFEDDDDTNSSTSSSSSWPKATWGIPLGKCVCRIRSRNDFLQGGNYVGASRREQLERLGFVWDVPEYRFRKFYTALQYYNARHHEQQHINSAIHLLDGTSVGAPLRVPSKFVVPKDDENWPRELWGYPLGAKCTAVRQKELYVKDNPRRRELLNDLRFQWVGNASRGWLEVVHAAAIYSKLCHRRLDVPYNFVVPSAPTNFGTTSCSTEEKEVWPWPEYLWGLPLGQRLKNVRVKGAYISGPGGAARRRQLDALGFNWTPKRGRPRKHPQ